jgi:putative redox protein
MNNQPHPEVGPGEVFVRELGGAYANEVITQHHRMVIDEPVPKGGKDRGPKPSELLLASLGSCISITLRMYAEHKQLPVDEISVLAKRDPPEKNKPAQIHVSIKVTGDLDESQLKRMRAIAKRCPVHRTITGDVEISHKLTHSV